MSGFTDSTPRSNKGDGDILEVRRQVISGDWSPINRGEYTLTDLGLRHNGNGLVWLRSGGWGVHLHRCPSRTVHTQRCCPGISVLGLAVADAGGSIQRAAP